MALIQSCLQLLLRLNDISGRINQKAIKNCVSSHVLSHYSSMKRTRTFEKAITRNKGIGDELDSRRQPGKIGDTVFVYDEPENAESIVESSTSISQNETTDTNDKSCTPLLSQKIESAQQKSKLKVNLRVLKDRITKSDKEVRQNGMPRKGKFRAIVDMEGMKQELKQLEDPPQTALEIEQCADRFQYSFYNTPCETLAQNLLGKILVRRLENGTILKGRIVETEGYLGTIDAASHTYQNKVTPRNAPMYMPPGTIYVYMTYGMYHCFNISSEELGAYVLIRGVEPIVGLKYMELLRNMRVSRNRKEKRIRKDVKLFKPFELCNGPFKICSAFFIEREEFNGKKIYMSDSLWIERDIDAIPITVVAAPRLDNVNSLNSEARLESFRYYISGDGCAVLIRAIDPIEGVSRMVDHRNFKAQRKAAAKRALKDFKVHELCNGPSKLCIAYQLDKSHSKYSMCTWKGLWLENDSTNSDITIVRSTRIGIDSSGLEWANKPLRYYIYGNKCVSKRDKRAEALLDVQ